MNRDNHSQTRLCASGTLTALALAASIAASAGAGEGQWPIAGRDLDNNRHQDKCSIDPSNVAGLIPAWELTVGGNVSATPSVDDRNVYFPDWAGNLYAVNRKTGNVLWQRTFADYTGVPGNFARATPAIDGNLLIVGDQGGRLNGPGAQVVAVDRRTGDLVWRTKVEDHPMAIVTQSATVDGDTVYVGVASFEELFAAVIPGYQCCTFRGSVVALNRSTGEIRWKTYMVPPGFSGNAVWGSSPAVDRKRGLVYIATGNNYSAPQSFLDCVAAAGTDASAQRACLAPYPTNYFDSVVALDLKTGAVAWSNTVIPFDVWTVSCLFGLPSCPDPEGPDFDFGQAPMLYAARAPRGPGSANSSGGKKVERLGIGQKSGTFWSLDPDTGATVWSTQVDPGGIAGGMIWGSATDGERIYTSSANSLAKPWTLPDGTSTTAGLWSALDASTGQILWQTANPTGATAGGAASVANGVVYVGSQDPDGHMYALDAATGAILWDFASGGSCNSGAAIVKDAIYWGSGYTALGPPGTPNDKFYAFELP